MTPAGESFSMRSAYSRLCRSGFVRSLAMLSGGTAAAQGINLLFAPAIARLYSPAYIGELALFLSFMSIASVALSFGYELGIVAAKTERSAAQLVLISLFATLPLSLFFSAVLHEFMQHQWLGFGVLPKYTPLLMMLGLLLIGTTSAVRYWEIRAERFGVISRSGIWLQGVRSLSQTASGVLWNTPVGLLTGELLGRGAGMITMFRDSISHLRWYAAGSAAGEFRATMKENRLFPMYSLPSSFIDTLATNMSVPLLIVVYGSDAGGYFAMVQRVMALPLALLTSNVADIFHGRLALYAREDPRRCLSFFRRTALLLTLAGIFPAAAFVLFGRPLFTIVFGHQWVMAGAMAGAVAPWFLAQFVVSPLSRVVLVFDGQRFKLIYDLLTVLGIAGVFWMAKHFEFTIMQTVWWVSAVNTISYATYFVVLLYLIRKVKAGDRSTEPAGIDRLAEVAEMDAGRS